jgi:RNA 3'-terminal phosphate cyclase (ATP)
MVVRIDGSAHTGGGGLLRVALGLSMLTGEPFSMTNIRSARSKPGLGHQHLTAVQLAARMCSASIEGAELGSERLLFMPARIEADTYELDITTAGSIPLALQPVLLAAAFSGKRFTFHLRGGTDVPHAPSADYLRAVFLPSIKQLARSDVEIAERGFYPKGEGRMIVRINSHYSTLTPCIPINFATPSKPVKLEFRITTDSDSNVCEHLELSGRSIGIETSAHLSITRTQGSSSTIIIHHADPIERAIGQSMLGIEIDALMSEAKRLLTLPCDEHLADQLIPYLAYHRGAIAHPFTDHMRAAIEVTERFLPGRLEIDEKNATIRSR